MRENDLNELNQRAQQDQPAQQDQRAQPAQRNQPTQRAQLDRTNRHSLNTP